MVHLACSTLHPTADPLSTLLTLKVKRASSTCGDSCDGAVQLPQAAQALLGRIPVPHELAHEQGLLETIWLLLTSVVSVPLICKLPGGSPVLGFLAGGAMIGPHALGNPPPNHLSMS